MDERSEYTRPRRSSVRMSLSAMNAAVEEKRSWLPPLVYLAHNPLTLVGLFFLNAAAVFWFFVLPVATQQGDRHPYLMIVFFGLIPIAFLLGLALTPLGAYLRYRQQTKQGVRAREFKPLGWDNREFRHMSVFAVVVTGCNVLVGGYVSQSTVHYMDSAGFCSTTCHAMSPEYAAYRRSPHLNIACVECHIGSGRRAYARAKLNGIWQVASTILELYPRPIPTPLENLRPAREICESCHWPSKFSGVQIRVFDHFAEDSANTQTTTILALTVGGGPVSKGVHGFHVAPDVVIEFEANQDRQEVGWVKYTSPDGTVREFSRAPWTAHQKAGAAARTMDCLDCHTRPSHGFEMPARALDAALALGDIDASLPWVRKKGLEILQADYASSREAEQEIPQALHRYYRTQHPDEYQSYKEKIEKSGRALAAIYGRNVFPAMGIGWGTYPDHSGHTDVSGCFRCHDNSLRDPNGNTIVGDCNACHRILAFRESEPDILKQLGLRP